ncbi:MAG: hypothetical protein HOA75_10145 [Deltaproteobacteria bacterium]|nr:hypothetical protein [Deltaproteobacteria bacterium]
MNANQLNLLSHQQQIASLQHEPSNHHDLVTVQIHHFAGSSHRKQAGAGFYTKHQGGQCQVGLGLLRNEDSCERPDEATAGDTEKHSSKE